MADSAHNWLLAGPWYRRQSLGGGAVKRSSRPILQKYAVSDFASDFISEPQRSLRFVGEDLVNNSTLAPTEPLEPGHPAVADNPLKLFLNSHSRFYLVVCELHCDRPGFPSVSGGKVAQAGFVVRRFATRLTETQRRAFEPVMRARALTQARIDRAGRQLRKLKAAHRKGPARRALERSLAKKQADRLAQLNAELAHTSQQLLALKEAHGVDVSGLRWVAGPHQGTGAWVAEADMGETDQEHSFPLYPLIPDPRDTAHSARGRNIWFGVVPTQSADVDGAGRPRFDDEGLYEVRCFVRRRAACCAGEEGGEEGCAETIWSEPTEVYRLASFFDLDGCSHTPVNITMPSFDQLRQQVARGPAGRGANVRVTTPDKSGIGVATGDGFSLPSSGGSPGDGSVCFFAIPLITIVAMFLLRLVLPMVVFLFNLWFLLSLRLCIPPSINLDLGLAADLKVLGPEFDFKASFDAGLSVDIGGQAVSSFAQLADVLKAGFDSGNVLDADLKKGMFDRLAQGKDVDEILRSMLDMSADYSDDPDPDRLPGTLPPVGDGLHYFDRVEPIQ